VRIGNDIDYTDISLVKKNNAAVDTMYKIVTEANIKGSKAIAELSTLLDKPGCAKWLAHQLVKRAMITNRVN